MIIGWTSDLFPGSRRNISGRSEEKTPGTRGEFLAMVMPVPHSPLEQPKPQVPLFPSWWYPKNGWFSWKLLLKWTIWGHAPRFRKSPFFKVLMIEDGFQFSRCNHYGFEMVSVTNNEFLFHATNPTFGLLLVEHTYYDERMMIIHGQ